MSIFIIDCESDGPIPGTYNMVCFGAVKVTPDLGQTFYGQTAPVTVDFIPEALKISGFTREEHENFPSPVKTMLEFVVWVGNTNWKGTRPIFMSDNPAFDWQWINYYLIKYAGLNPFGFSARRIGDFYSGLRRDWFASSEWKSLRKTRHTHNPVDDAKGNAEALLSMIQTYGLKVPLE